MTIAEIAQRANVSVDSAVREMSRIIGSDLTAESTLSIETAGLAVLILAINKVI